MSLMVVRVHIQPYDAALRKIDIVPILCFLCFLPAFVVTSNNHLSICNCIKKQQEFYAGQRAVLLGDFDSPY